MKVIIVEDEIATSENLIFLLKSIDSNIEILKVLDSVKSVVKYFSSPNEAELIFIDIHLGDGISFEIFEKVNIFIPLIFTTAYDQYAIKAFKLNSIDYLLKPVNEEELSEAIEKYKSRLAPIKPINDQMQGLLKFFHAKNKVFKKTYLIQIRDELIPVKTENLAYFFIETGIVKGITFDNQLFIIDKKIEDIEGEIDPSIFYRVNRQIVLNRNAIVNIKYYFNGKLVVNTNPKFTERIVVSKAKATHFKNWINA
ncbi:MAG: DNA-binding response regulator [Flavobacteriaceae bacterium]|nr:MAG: DNA-binding response regulator [Flavobacteriaceae bacterium]